MDINSNVQQRISEISSIPSEIRDESTLNESDQPSINNDNDILCFTITMAKVDFIYDYS